MGVHGNTDSEWAFALFLDCLERAGFDPDGEEYSITGFGHTALRNAMLQTIQRINQFVADIPPDARREDDNDDDDVEGVDSRSLLNFAVSDGHSVICTRYVSSKTDEAASLYFSSGTNWKYMGEKGLYKMERRDKGADIVLVASEPLTFERGMSNPPFLSFLFFSFLPFFFFFFLKITKAAGPGFFFELPRPPLSILFFLLFLSPFFFFFFFTLVTSGGAMHCFGLFGLIG